MDDRSEALAQIADSARRHSLTAAEIAHAIGEDTPAVAGERDKRRRSVLVSVLGFLGGTFVFAGIGVFIALQWNSMNSAARVIVTLGSGCAGARARRARHAGYALHEGIDAAASRRGGTRTHRYPGRVQRGRVRRRLALGGAHHGRRDGGAVRRHFRVAQAIHTALHDDLLRRVVLVDGARSRRPGRRDGGADHWGKPRADRDRRRSQRPSRHFAGDLFLWNSGLPGTAFSTG